MHAGTGTAMEMKLCEQDEREHTCICMRDLAELQTHTAC